MIKAYLLVKMEPGADLDSTSESLAGPGITSVEMLMGPYDAIVAVEAPDPRTLGEIAKRVRRCPGVQDSMTCPVM